MSALVLQNSYLQSQITVLIGTALMSTAKVHLFKNNFAFTKATALIDLVEADYTGYAANLITWSPVTQSDAGIFESVGICDEFRPTGTAITNTIYGFMLVDTTGAILIGGGNFDNGPLPMASALDSILPILRFQPSFGGEVVTVS